MNINQPVEKTNRPFGPRPSVNQAPAIPPTESWAQPHDTSHQNIQATQSRHPFGPRIPLRKSTVEIRPTPLRRVQSHLTTASDSSQSTIQGVSPHLSVLWTLGEFFAIPGASGENRTRSIPKKPIRPLPARPRGDLNSSKRRRLPPTAQTLSSYDVPFSFTMRNVPDLGVHIEDPIKDPFGSRGGVPSNAPLWKHYMEEAQHYDKSNIENWNQNMDVILIFAGLFSAILTAFLVEFYKPLQQDPTLKQLMIMTNLLQVSAGLINATSASIGNGADSYHPSASVLAVNVLWFVSLTCSLGAAMGAMVIKQWLQFYMTNFSSSPFEYAHQHQYRLSALLSWHVPSIISALPFIMLTSVVLFLFGLGWQLVLLNDIVGIVVISFIAVVLLCYLCSVVFSIIFPECPYKTSVLTLLNSLKRYAALIFLWTRKISWKRVSNSQNSKIISLLGESTKEREIKEIREKQSQLAVNGISWLLNVSQKEETIHQALTSVLNIVWTDNLVLKLLGCNAMEQMAQRANVPLPALTHEFWQHIDNLSPYHPIFKNNKDARIYIKVLISTWHHPAYFKLDKPPVISSEYDMDRQNKAIEQKNGLRKHHQSRKHIAWIMDTYLDPYYTCLLGDWLLLWRLLRQNNGNKLSVLAKKGFDLNFYAEIVCIEVCHYHLQKYVTPLYLPHNRGAFIDLHDLLEALHEEGQQLLGLHDDTVWLLLDTLAYVFSGIEEAPLELQGMPRTWFSPSQSPSLTRTETVTMLLNLLKSNGMRYNLTTKKIVLCLQMLVPVPMVASSRKQFFLQYQQENPSKEELFDQVNMALIGVLYVFVPELSARQQSASEIHRKIAVLTSEQLYCSSLQSVTMATHHDQLFIQLPEDLAEQLLFFIGSQSSLITSVHQSIWLLNVLLNWYQSKRLSQTALHSCFDVIQSLMQHTWSDTDHAKIAEDILSFCSLIWKNPDSLYGNLVCGSLCNLLHQTMVLHNDRRLLKYYIETQTLVAVCAFLGSKECNQDNKINWYHLVSHWHNQLDGHHPSALEVYQFGNLKRALGTLAVASE